jgi:DNA recombination protein RmuC
MNEWLIAQGINNPLIGALVGLLVGLLFAIVLAWFLSRRAARALAESEQGSAVLQTRLADREQHYREQIEKLEEAEKRLSENFERLAGRIFEERSEKLSDLNTKQLDAVLKPLGERLGEFRNTVESAHKQETAQHQVMKEKIGDLEKLNKRLHEDATNLSRALTSNVKAQGNWGEQQLERLLEISGLQKGKEYSTQFSVTSDSGQRVQPDLVLHLPEDKAIVLDSKVSLLAWTRFQACEDDEEGRSQALREHIQSIRQHIRNLGE